MSKCPQCDTDFSRSSLRQKYCSRKCLERANWARQKVKLSDWSTQDKSAKCAECHQLFVRAERWQKYCGKRCNEAARSKRRWPHKPRPKKKTLQCKQCGVSFVLDRPNRLGRARFCSPPCWYQWIRNHNRSNGDRKKRRYGLDWEKIAAKIRRRDDFVCQSCGNGEETKALSVDHIVPLRLAQKLADKNPSLDQNAEINLVSLCGPCHTAKTHVEQSIHRGCTGEFFEWVALIIGRRRTWNAMEYFGVLPAKEQGCQI